MENKTSFKLLYQALLSLENEEECRRFLDDVCTIKELQAMSQRLDVAIMLSQNKTFNSIAAATGASTTTIARVNRCLQYGDGGYKVILERLSNLKEDF